MNSNNAKSAAIIVAHPDDETLWAGGTILSNPSWKWFVVCLCRGSDEGRAPRFFRALKVLEAEGTIGDLDDGPGQIPLADEAVERAILDLLPPERFDLLITHNPTGEYTKHLRHEETNKAVTRLWNAGEISASELWTFAYEDGNKAYYPRPVESAPVFLTLSNLIWIRKYRIITEIYGFGKDGWEARTTPLKEAFWQFSNPAEARKWLDHGGLRHESTGVV